MANVDEEVTKLRKDMDQLMTDISSLSGAVRDLGKETGRATVEDLKAKGRSARAEASALQDRVDSEIQERPLTSVLMSFGIGFLIGLLLDRRR